MYPRMLTARGALQLPTGGFELNRNSPQAAGLEAWLPFLDSRGSNTVRDRVGNLNGVLTGSAAWQSDPRFGSVVDFAAGDYLNAADALAGFSGAVSTVSMWVQVDQNDNSGIVWFGTQTGTAVYWQTSQPLGEFVVVHAQLCDISGDDLNILYNGEWHHIAFVSDGTASGKLFYLDGVVPASFSPGANVPTAVAAGDKTFRIGNWGGGTIWDLDGRIAQFRLRNYPVPAATIWQEAHPPTMWDLYKPVSRYWPVSVATAPPSGNPWYYYAQQM